MGSLKNQRFSCLFPVLLICALCIFSCNSSSHSGKSSSSTPEGQTEEALYDLVIAGGRVIDPETGRDEIATIGIKDGIIVTIAAGTTLDDTGTEIIDASGLVVSPGFINTHTHEGNGIEQLYESSSVYVQDGITFWLGGNCGISPTKTIIIPQDSLDNGELIQTLPEFLDEVEQNEALYNNYATLSGNITLRREAGCGFGQEETDDQIADMLTFLERDLAVGSFGISYGSFYDPGTTKNAMIELAKTSRSSGGMAASHIRQMLINLRNVFWEYEGDNPCVQEFYDLINIILFKDSLIEAIDTCREADIPYIVSHLTDMAYNDSTHWALETIQAAIVEQSLPLAADIIGYDTFKNDLYALTRFGEIPVKLLMLLTGLEPGQFWLAENVYVDGQLYMEAYQTFENIDQIEYLVQAFSESRASAPPESDSYSVAVWCNIVDPESTMLALTYPFVFIGNDGSVSRNETSGEVDVQPRTYACFSRLLGHWSRTENAIPMKETLFKATIAPALWLGLDRKGRLQQGCDADITVFDPDTIIDRAKPELGKLDLPPEGIHYVIVNGKVVVENGELTGTTPGRLIRRTWSVPGNTQAVISLYQDKFPD